ncbi:hypothetical protein Kfla_2188 [Kribbella flavida DSM 17836]|uniref:DUF4913 domain-containing protein n=1 Tax=Kribbella flavida (strain DSM 17836 / JCM 10339 / NBRC 14399) TaxID=479435 RepID=D2PTF4_KRIFD|nr:hypothetical protein [Kribbella flavida]ADB31267.1 hypothetical protein Kfla_2188 [Kribbella flavida DSM 17836]
MKHDDLTEPGEVALAAVSALSREFEAMRRDHAAMKKGLRNTASATQVTQLAQAVTDLGEAMRKAPAAGKKDEAEPVPSWLNLPLDDPEPAQQLLGDLIAWMRDIYLRYGDARKSLPACWMWHGEIVEELVWLMFAWTAAYQGPQAQVRLAGDWHDRQRPGVTKRIETYADGCDLLAHRDQTPGSTTVSVPLVEAADDIVAWWTERRNEPGPVPTREQITTTRPGGLSVVPTTEGGRR